MSGSAGVMSSHAAKPAKPAPPTCMSPIACAGTSLARSTPNRSTKLTRKYRIPLSRAVFARSMAMVASCHASAAALRPPRIRLARPRTFHQSRPGIQPVPASGIPAIAAASTVSAARSSGSRLRTWLLPLARAIVWSSRTIAVR